MPQVQQAQQKTQGSPPMSPSGVGDLTGLLGPAALFGPALSSPTPAPSITPSPVTSSPTFTPLNPGGASLSSGPPVNPVVTGTSTAAVMAELRQRYVVTFDAVKCPSG